jgi:hypothetical protein
MFDFNSKKFLIEIFIIMKKIETIEEKITKEILIEEAKAEIAEINSKKSRNKIESLKRKLEKEKIKIFDEKTENKKKNLITKLLKMNTKQKIEKLDETMFQNFLIFENQDISILY